MIKLERFGSNGKIFAVACGAACLGKSRASPHDEFVFISLHHAMNIWFVV
jgi:hypothetical protein